MMFSFIVIRFYARHDPTFEVEGKSFDDSGKKGGLDLKWYELGQVLGSSSTLVLTSLTYAYNLLFIFFARSHVDALFKC